MSRKVFTLAISLAVASYVVPRAAFAEDPVTQVIHMVMGRADAHLSEAIRQTQEAIEHGRMRHPKGLAAHATAALSHAAAAEQIDDNPDTQEGIAHLNASIAAASRHHVRVAIKHAKKALAHLKAADPAEAAFDETQSFIKCHRGTASAGRRELSRQGERSVTFGNGSQGAGNLGNLEPYCH